jgi:hypothetical protein
MRLLNAIRWSIGVAAASAACLAAAATIVVTFPEFNGAPIDTGFPQPAVTVGVQAISIPAGDRIDSAVISGYWGTTAKPDSTAGVTVLLDGVEVARCEKPDTGCWVGDSGQRPLSHTFTAPELLPLSDGTATLTAVQTSDEFLRLGVSTLVIQTTPLAIVPPPSATVPTLSPFGLLALLAGVAVAGMTAVKRRRHG